MARRRPVCPGSPCLRGRTGGRRPQAETWDRLGAGGRFGGRPYPGQTSPATPRPSCARVRGPARRALVWLPVHSSRTEDDPAPGGEERRAGVGFGGLASTLTPGPPGSSPGDAQAQQARCKRSGACGPRASDPHPGGRRGGSLDSGCARQERAAPTSQRRSFPPSQRAPEAFCSRPPTSFLAARPGRLVVG